MRCKCCDRVLGPTEVSWNTDCDEWEFCGSCLVAIKEIFGDGDHLTEEEIDESLEDSNVEGGDLEELYRSLG